MGSNFIISPDYYSSNLLFNSSFNTFNINLDDDSDIDNNTDIDTDSIPDLIDIDGNIVDDYSEKNLIKKNIFYYSYNKFLNYLELDKKFE